MGLRVMFVVAVDVDEKQAYIDDRTFMQRFGLREGIWDTDLECWVDVDDDGETYYEALRILNYGKFAKD